MNLISITEADFTSNSQVQLMGRRFEHIKKILKAQIGQNLRLGLLDGKLGWGEVLDLQSDKIRLQVNLNEDPPLAAPVSLIVALPRPKSLPRIIQAITSLGVKRIAFINTWKVEKCFWSSDYLSRESIDQAIILGLEQAVDTIKPHIEFFRLFKPFVEDHMNEWCGKSFKIVCHPQIEGKKLSNSLEECKSVLALGPEGGFIDYEIEQFLKHGFQPFSLGPRILRLETAIPALVSQFYFNTRKDC
ncbi:MAG: 16S rRNA (uracil(1498)-N(3))-methyltransferase [Bdellovibrionales bacterium]|nr:16S rRNA (uracil(1498)-N(3))-methyltransferase [Bdellovibrionales bacterium]